MANVPSGGVVMKESVVIRATPQDKIDLKKAVAKRGTTVGAFIRGLLIEQGYISHQA